MENNGLTISQATVLTGLSAHTLRYYERVDLLGPVRRDPSGHRRYSEGDVAWIRFLSRLRTTGMPIRKMKQFADFRREGDSTFPERRALLEEHRTAVRRCIAGLERDLTAINEKVELYAEMEARNDATRADGTDAV